MKAKAFVGTVIVRYLPEEPKGILLVQTHTPPGKQTLVRAEVVSSRHPDYDVGDIVCADKADGFQCDHRAFDFVPEGEKYGFYKDDLHSAIPVKMNSC